MTIMCSWKEEPAIDTHGCGDFSADFGLPDLCHRAALRGKGGREDRYVHSIVPKTFYNVLQSIINRK